MLDRPFYGPYTFCKICEHFFSVPGIFKPGACQEKTFFWREKSCCSDCLLGLYCALSSKFRLMLILMEPIKGCTPATRIPNHPRNAATLLFVRPSVCMSILYGTMSGELRLQRRTKKPMNIQVSNLEKQEIFAFKWSSEAVIPAQEDAPFKNLVHNLAILSGVLAFLSPSQI